MPFAPMNAMSGRRRDSCPSVGHDHRVGDDDEGATGDVGGPGGDALGEEPGGRAGVEGDGSLEARGDEPHGGVGDARLGVGVARAAGVEALLGARRAVRADRAAVHPAQDAARLQLGEVAADGLGRDVEVAGEGDDRDPAGALEEGDHPVLAFLGVHGRSPSTPRGDAPRVLAL
jgi:hypothetical protein